MELNKFNKDYKDGFENRSDRWMAFLRKTYEFDKDNIPEELEEDREIKKLRNK